MSPEPKHGFRYGAAHVSEVDLRIGCFIHHLTSI